MNRARHGEVVDRWESLVCTFRIRNRSCNTAWGDFQRGQTVSFLFVTLPCIFHCSSDPGKNFNRPLSPRLKFFDRPLQDQPTSSRRRPGKIVGCTPVLLVNYPTIASSINNLLLRLKKSSAGSGHAAPAQASSLWSGTMAESASGTAESRSPAAMVMWKP